MTEALVIVPTYNERDNLPRLVPRILDVKPAVDVLIVDDKSPDGTGEVADELARASPAVHTLHRPGKLGLGRAYVAGFKWALARGYKYFCQMDADLSHSPEALPAFFAAMQRYDLVLGSRYVGGIRVLDWDMTRLFISSFGNWYARLATGLPLFRPDRWLQVLYPTGPGGDRPRSDSQHRVRVSNRDDVVAVQRGFRVGEIPIIFNGRDHGETKFSRSIAWEAAWTVWKLRLGLIRNGGSRRQAARGS